MQPFYPMATSQETLIQMIDSLPMYLRAFVVCETPSDEVESLIVDNTLRTRRGGDESLPRIYDSLFGIEQVENGMSRALWGGRKRTECDVALEYCANRPNAATLIFHHLLLHREHSVVSKYDMDEAKHIEDAAYTTLTHIAATTRDLTATMLGTKYMVKLHELVAAADADAGGPPAAAVADTNEINKVYNELKDLQLPLCMKVVRVSNNGGNEIKKTLVIVNSCAVTGWHHFCFSVPFPYVQALHKLGQNSLKVLETNYHAIPSEINDVIVEIFRNEILCGGLKIPTAKIPAHPEGDDDDDDDDAHTHSIETILSNHIVRIAIHTNMLALTHAFVGNIDLLARAAALSQAEIARLNASSGATDIVIGPIIPPPPPSERRENYVPETLYSNNIFTSSIMKYLSNDTYQNVLKLFYETYCCYQNKKSSSSQQQSGREISYALLPQPNAKRRHDLLCLVKYDRRRQIMEVWDSININHRRSKNKLLTPQVIALLKRVVQGTQHSLLPLLSPHDGEDEEDEPSPPKRMKLIETSESARELANKLYNLQQFAALTAAAAGAGAAPQQQQNKSGGRQRESGRERECSRNTKSRNDLRRNLQEMHFTHTVGCPFIARRTRCQRCCLIYKQYTYRS